MNNSARVAPRSGSDGGLDREVLLVGAVVVAGTLTAILDATVVNVGVASIGREFNASVSQVQWVITAYLLAFASVIPLSGWATGRFGAKRVWLASLVAFVAGSALAGSAPSITALIGFRVLQGLGGGLLMPVGQTILAQAAGPARIGRVMSVVGIPMLLAPVFGPVIGGALVDDASWRWMFFVNLPVGVAAILLARRLLPSAPAVGHRGLDLRGLVLLSPGIAVFVYGLSEAGRAGGPGNGRALAGTIAGFVLLALFVAHARRRRQAALLDLSLLSNRGFAAAAATNLLVGVALFGALILLPLYFQTARGESPLATGLLMAPQGLGAAVAMPLAGRLTDIVGGRVVIPTGLVVALVGTAGYTQVGADTSYPFLACALFVIGLGLGATVMPSMAVAYQAVARESVAHATSMINVVQRIAASVGTTLLAVVLQRTITTQVPGVGGGLAGVVAAPPGVHEHVAPALAQAFGTTFWVAFGLVGAALLPALALPAVRRGQQVAPPSADEPDQPTQLRRDSAAV